MRGSSQFFLLFALLSLLPTSLMAQDPIAPWISAGGYPGSTSTGDEFEARAFRPQTYKIVAARVSTPKGNPVANATVVITNNVAAPAKILATDHEGDFVAEYNLFDEEMGRNFIAIIQVTKKGLQVAHRITPMGGSVNNSEHGHYLAPYSARGSDPAFPGRFDQWRGPEAQATRTFRRIGRPRKKRTTPAACRSFSTATMQIGPCPTFAKVAKLNPSCLRCRTMLALAELSWGDWDDPPHELGEAINALIADRKLGSPEPLLTYGVLLSWRHEPDKASRLLYGSAQVCAPGRAGAIRNWDASSAWN